MNDMSGDPYVLDKDKNGFLGITKKNADFIYAVLKIDSSYRKTFDMKSEESAYGYVIQHTNSLNEIEVMTEICKRLDKESSTHLYTTGKNYNGKMNGLELTAKRIISISDLENRLFNGDANLVNEIAGFADMNKFSFASKFCAYMCRFLFDGTKQMDNYVIYDNVLAKTLPYYEKYFLKSTNHKTKEGADSVKSVFMDNKNYEGYRKYVDRIRIAASKENKFKLSREKFDYMIWYYYKGGEWEKLYKYICDQNK